MFCMTISEVLPSLSLSFPICTMGWGIRLCDFFPQALRRVSQGKPSLLSAARFPESGLQSSSLFHPAPLTLLSLLPCVRQEVSGEAFCTELSQSPEGKTEAGLPPHSGLGTGSKAKWELGLALFHYPCHPHTLCFSRARKRAGQALSL